VRLSQAAITAALAKGLALEEAVAEAKRFITEAIRTNPGLVVAPLVGRAPQRPSAPQLLPPSD